MSRDRFSLFDLFRRFPDGAAAECWFEQQRWPDGQRFCPDARDALQLFY